jgi:hypothetical protein
LGAAQFGCADLSGAAQFGCADLLGAAQFGCADLLGAAQQFPLGLFLRSFSSGHLRSPAGRKMKDGPEQWSKLEQDDPAIHARSRSVELTHRFYGCVSMC